MSGIEKTRTMLGETIDFNEYRRAWRKANPEKMRAQEKRRRDKNPEKIRAKNRASYKRNRKSRLQKANQKYINSDKDKLRDVRLRCAYGISLGDYLNMYLSQDGRCACCNIPRPSSGKSGLVVDHNHNTGKVRALLCMPCNVSIGQLGESSLRAHAVADYIDRWTK